MSRQAIVPFFAGFVFFLPLLTLGQTPVAGQPSPLGQRQSQLGDRFGRFETLLLRLADVESAENPERAALLRRASRLARETFILERIKSASLAINEGQFSQAIKEQGAASESLSALLQLLQSEDRQERIRQEKERLRQLVNDIRRLERAQRSTRGQTQQGADLKTAEQQQEEITEKTTDLEKRIAKEKEKDAKPAEGEVRKGDAENSPQSEDPKEPDAGKGNPNDKDPPNTEKPESKEDKPNQDGDQKPEQPDSDKPPSESNPSNDSKPANGAKPPSGPQSPQDQASEQIKKAQQQMQQAMERIKQQQRNEAAESQQAAEEALREAAEQLERTLKQLREEEIERQLARLESRLRELAARQTQVLEKTRTLAATPAEQRDRQLDVQASNLSFEEKKIAMDTDRALLLLAEDGSGRAFPEVLGEVRDDMLRVAARLSQTQIDVVTQGLQEDILAALDEMIKALQQEQRKREQQPPSPPQQGQPGGQQQENPLVDKIAELKLIKTQEVRIKSSTQRYTDISKQAAPDADLNQLLSELGQRQIRLYRVVRDILVEQQK